MMAAEQPGNDVEMEQLEPQPVLSIRATIQIVDLAQAQDDRIRALSSYLQQCGAQPTVNRAAVTYLQACGYRIDLFFTLYLSDEPLGAFDRYICTTPTFFI
jgi:hypothetical protein